MRSKKLLFLTILTLMFCFLAGNNINADQDFSGWAWSENIGWISLSCSNLNTCNTVNYGIKINSTTGNFSGWAWSENIGWIDFAPAGPYPSAPNYSAKVDLITGEVSGWARALAYDNGWDGWIKLAGTNYNVSANQNIGSLSGWAWSDMVIGWISFKGYTSGTISAPTSLGTAWNHCGFQGVSITTFSWNSIPSQSAYQIRISPVDNFPIDAQGNPVLTAEEFKCASQVCSGGASTTFTPTVSEWKNWQKWNTQYWWQVRVKDSQGNWSPWSTSSSFKTPLHAFPFPEFSWSPETPALGETVVFTDQSVCYSSPGNTTYFCKNNSNNRYQWDFGNDGTIDCDSNVNSTCRGNITYIIQSSKTYVKLTITDDVGSCSFVTPNPISIGAGGGGGTGSGTPGKWREIPPF